MAVEQDDFSDSAVEQRVHNVFDNQVQRGGIEIDRQRKLAEVGFGSKRNRW